MNHVDRGSRHVFGEINITPLTDIFLVLLIIVIVVAPNLANTRRDIKMPRVTTGDGIEKTWLTVEITPDGSFYMDAKVVKLDDLEATLKGKLATAKDKFLVVRGDRASKSRAVMAVFQAAKDAGFERVMVAGESEDKKDDGKPDSAPPAKPETPREGV